MAKESRTISTLRLDIILYALWIDGAPSLVYRIGVWSYYSMISIYLLSLYHWTSVFGNEIRGLYLTFICSVLQLEYLRV